MTLQQIDEQIQKLQNIVDRGKHVGGAYQEQGAAVAKCMPVIQELRARIDNQWLPIETAPRDCTRIIGASAGCTPHCVYWNTTHNAWMIEYADAPSWQPTHWMPLPQNPITLKTTQTHTSLIDTILQ